MALERVGDGLHGVFGIFVAIAGEADNEAPAVELIFARARDHHEIFNTRTNAHGGRECREQQND